MADHARTGMVGLVMDITVAPVDARACVARLSLPTGK